MKNRRILSTNVKMEVAKTRRDSNRSGITLNFNIIQMRDDTLAVSKCAHTENASLKNWNRLEIDNRNRDKYRSTYFSFL